MLEIWILFSEYVILKNRFKNYLKTILKDHLKKIVLNLLMLLTATNEALSGKGVLNRTG